MSVSSRKVKNKKAPDGTKTGKPGTVYDISIKYKDADGNLLSYGKRGFITKKEAESFEDEMIKKLNYSGYEPPSAEQEKQTLKQYLEEWVEIHGKTNLRPRVCLKIIYP